MIRKRPRNMLASFLISALLICGSTARPQQKLDKFKVEQGQLILESVHEEVKKHYYDPTYHGVNIDAAFAQAKEKISGVDSLSRTFRDYCRHAGHSPRFAHFSRASGAGVQRRVWISLQMIGDKCMITNVRPGTDAEKKGLKPGDQILAINDHPLDRETLFKLDYLYEVLSPQPGLILNVQSPDREKRRLQIQVDIEHFNSADGANDILYRANKQEENERSALSARIWRRSNYHHRVELRHVAGRFRHGDLENAKAQGSRAGYARKSGRRRIGSGRFSEECHES